MPNVNFSDPTLLGGGQIVVSGPFTPAQVASWHIEGKVTIRFMVEHQLGGAQEPVRVSGTAEWEAPAPSWQEVIPSGDLQPGTVRLTGVALIRWDADDGIPNEEPAFETFNWSAVRTIQPAP